MVDPADSAFYQTPKSFNGVGVNVAHDVNLGTVADSLVLLHAPSNPIIDGVFIREDCALWQNVFVYDPQYTL